MVNNTSNTGYDDGTLKRVHNPIYEETTPGSADFPSEGAEQQTGLSEGGGPTYETIMIFSSQHKRSQKENGKVHTKENTLTLPGQSIVSATKMRIAYRNKCTSKSQYALGTS